MKYNPDDGKCYCKKEDEEIVNDKCVPKCQMGYHRNPDTGVCEAPPQACLTGFVWSSDHGICVSLTSPSSSEPSNPILPDPPSSSASPSKPLENCTDDGKCVPKKKKAPLVGISQYFTFIFPVARGHP
jgi:hypothetical protein